MVFLKDRFQNVFKNKKILYLVFINILIFTLLSSVSAVQYDNDTTSDICISDASISEISHDKSILSSSISADGSSSASNLTSESRNYTISSNLSNDEIQSIFDSSNSGDTIQFTDKNYYNLSIIVEKQLNIFSNSNSVIYTADSSNDKAVQYGIYDSFAFLFTNGSSGSVLKGLSFTGDSDYKIIVDGADNITLNNNNLQGAKESAVLINNSKYDVIANNSISNSNYGISLNNANRTLVSNNKIYSCSNTGLVIEGSSINNITQNKIYKNGLDGILLENGRLNKILNNTITNNKISGLRLEGNTTRNTIKYNNISSNVINIYANSMTNGDTITQNILMYAKVASNTYTTDDNTGSAIVFADNYTAAKAGTMVFAYNTVGFNEYWDAKSTMSHPSVEIGSNWYFDNDGNYAVGHICPMVFGGYLSPEDLKHLSMGFSTTGNGIIGQLFEGSNAVGAGSFTIDNINVNGKDYGRATVDENGRVSIDLSNVKVGSKVTITINGHSFTVDVDKEVNVTDSSKSESSESGLSSNENENEEVTSTNGTDSTKGNGTGSGTGSKTGTGSGDGNFTGSGIAVGDVSGESNSGTGTSGDNGGGSGSEGITAYEILQEVQAAAAKNSQLIAVAAVVFVILIIALGYRSKDKINNLDDDNYEL